MHQGSNVYLASGTGTEGPSAICTPPTLATATPSRTTQTLAKTALSQKCPSWGPCDNFQARDVCRKGEGCEVLAPKDDTECPSAKCTPETRKLRKAKRRAMRRLCKAPCLHGNPCNSDQVCTESPIEGSECVEAKCTNLRTLCTEDHGPCICEEKQWCTKSYASGCSKIVCTSTFRGFRSSLE
jgi:hypothetical protein